MRDKLHHSRPLIQSRARSMRHEPAPAEALLWSRLRGGKLDGLKFRRQQPFDHFILDFYCAAARVAIELDGASHLDQLAYDDLRSRRLEENDIVVVRFLNEDVFDHLDAVLEEIYRVCQSRLCPKCHPSPQPSPAGGEGE